MGATSRQTLWLAHHDIMVGSSVKAQAPGSRVPLVSFMEQIQSRG